MKRKGKQIVNSKKHIVDGIEFRSGLEVYMYRRLLDGDIDAEYEKNVYELISPFFFPNSSIERTTKGDFINRGNKKVLGMKYTPDFVGDGFIIEVKGRPNERFPVVWKLFKKMIVTKGIDVDLYMPRNKKDCDDVVESIIKKRKL